MTPLAEQWTAMAVHLCGGISPLLPVALHDIGDRCKSITSH
jgi:hypothetical protein